MGIATLYILGLRAVLSPDHLVESDRLLFSATSIIGLLLEPNRILATAALPSSSIQCISKALTLHRAYMELGTNRRDSVIEQPRDVFIGSLKLQAPDVSAECFATDRRLVKQLTILSAQVRKPDASEEYRYVDLFSATQRDHAKTADWFTRDVFLLGR